MRFQHVRTGKVIDVPDEDAHRYRNDRYVPVSDDLIGEHEPAAVIGVAVPSGTVAEVLSWVGDDDLRRQSALTAERAGKNRKGIIEALEG